MSSSFSSSLFNSRYGKTSDNTCPPTGAATTPPWCPPSPFGSYKVTRTITVGSDIGATPKNEATYLFVLTPSSEVPVFPPTLYPFTWALFPVPKATTDSIIFNISSACSFEITLSPVFTGTSFTSPVLLFIICFTTLGLTFTPPFAIVLTAVASCIGVISNL